MKLLCIFVAILVFVIIEYGDALDCYECNLVPFESNSEENCNDPFNSDGIKTVSCDGRCMANQTSAVSPQGSFTEVHRGCLPSGEICLPTICQSSANPADPSQTSTFCNYCCDEDNCNSLSFEEATAGVVTMSCWTCTDEGDEMAGSCSSPDFNGMSESAAAIPLPCDSSAEGKCAVIKAPANPDTGEKASFTRGCNTGNACVTLAQAPDYDVDCCDWNLCNVGSNVQQEPPASTAEPGDGDGDDDKKDDDKKGTIECWSCEVSNVTYNQSDCFKGSFPADGVTKEDCPTGTCISYTNVSPTDTSKMLFFRGCLTPAMENAKYCDDDDNKNIKDNMCCDKNLCNNAGILVINLVAIFGAMLICIGVM